MSFKIGDIVRRKGSNYVGKIIQIKKDDLDLFNFKVQYEDNYYSGKIVHWEWVCENDIELAETSSKNEIDRLPALKTGMKVQLRNGDFYTVLDNPVRSEKLEKIILKERTKDLYMLMSNYNEEGYNKYEMDAFDIMSIWEPASIKYVSFDNHDNYEKVWERVKKVEMSSEEILDILKTKFFGDFEYKDGKYYRIMS